MRKISFTGCDAVEGVFETQDLLDRGEQQINRVVRSGRNALESVASKLE
jgi:hypothetical protein